MKHKHLALTLGAILTSTIILYSCKKINESTELGGDLIPPVDNITTFDTTLNIEAYTDTFSLANDSTTLNSSQEHFLGQITNDPLFGKTNAKIFLELKPASFKFNFLSRPDSLHIDSVVMILDYVETYGDSTAPQTVNVYEVAQSSDFRYDSTYRIRENNIATSTLLGSRTFAPQDLKDSVRAYQDTSANQLRIRLDDSFGARLLSYDTVNNGSHIDAFASDSAFKRALNGFALESVNGGNALMGFDLNGVNTKLAIYYKDDNNDAPVAQWDTAVAYFTFAGNLASASASLVTHDYSGTALAAASNGTTAPPDDYVYVQTTPGSFATLKIPALPGLSNRIVHRAELIVDEAYDPSDLVFTPPSYLYLDAYDPILADYRTIPYDVLADVSGSLSLTSFGIMPINETDGSNVIKTWHFNLTRYVQHIVNHTESTYDLRLYAPFDAHNQYKPSSASVPTKLSIPVNPTIAKGRIRLYGGDPTVTNPHRMRLRIVYSKI